MAGPAQRVVRARHLHEEDDDAVWQHNAWDDLHWTPEMEADAEACIARQQQQAGDAPCVEEGSQWDRFYLAHDRWFFKDRKWLPTEFPELFQAASVNIMEVGCGAGNTVWPILRENRLARIWACDFSAEAVQLVRTHREYDADRMTVWQHDLSGRDELLADAGVKMDVVVAVFVLSALHPSSLQHALEKIGRALKPGGLLLFRDYGRMDLTQLRFPPSRFVCAPDCYRRGDGTLVHYFTEAELLQRLDAQWTVADLRTDRRLLVNRKRHLLMRRVWIQGKFASSSNK